MIIQIFRGTRSHTQKTRPPPPTRQGPAPTAARDRDQLDTMLRPAEVATDNAAIHNAAKPAAAAASATAAATRPARALALPDLAYDHVVEFHIIASAAPFPAEQAVAPALAGIADGLALSSLHSALGVWDTDTDTKFRSVPRRPSFPCATSSLTDCASM